MVAANYLTSPPPSPKSRSPATLPDSESEHLQPSTPASDYSEVVAVEERMTDGEGETNSRIDPEPDKYPASGRTIGLVTPISSPATILQDNVEPPDLDRILSVSADDFFSDGESVHQVHTEDTNEVQTVDDDPQSSDTIPDHQSPSYLPALTSGSATIMLTPESPNLRPNPLAVTRWSDSDND